MTFERLRTAVGYVERASAFLNIVFILALLGFVLFGDFGDFQNLVLLALGFILAEVSGS